MTRIPDNPGSWPEIMRAPTAAAYCDEVSVEAFLRRVGSVYPKPVVVSGRGKVWLKEKLDETRRALGSTPNGAGQSLAEDL